MNEDRARDAVDHLQTAALELIAAARAALEVAEGLVRAPRPNPPSDAADREGGGITHIDVEP